MKIDAIQATIESIQNL